MSKADYQNMEYGKVQMPEMENVQVVVLMGGTGSRLADMTKSVPKPMLSVCGEPFFLYQFRLLLLAGFKKFLFLVGYYAEQIRDYFADGSKYGVQIDYCYDGPDRLGTAGAIVQAYDKLDDSFLLLYGDTLLDIDYYEIVYRFYLGKLNEQTSLMAVYRNEDRLDISNVNFKDGVIVEYNKRIPTETMHYIDYGISAFDRKVFAGFQRGDYVDLSDIQMKQASEKLMTACVVRKRFYEIGTPVSFAYFEEYAQKRYCQPQRAVFVDRDGVINEIVLNDDTGQLDSPLGIDEFSFMDGAVEGLRTLKEKGYLLFIITNQPAAAKGKTSLERLYDVNGHMLDKLNANGIEIDDIQMCPHHPTGSSRSGEKFLIRKCGCRKPGIKMIDNILKKYCIDIKTSYMIGDSFTDIQAGKRAGLRTAFIGDFKCDVCRMLSQNKPDLMGKSLVEIAKKL